MNPDDEKYSAPETARRRDEVVRRMANTPPQPKIIYHRERKKKAGADRAAGKNRADRER
jgi:hypothetical protein